eukprot:TRINITY_DN1128_c0_g1_i5.p1 TRINITY_DN1128_c0_g1~~TRINITY_DN1128_c0_g1_i5.p1  ORF type:complete len:228 (-),score=39.72 TRINITY_DN1128_c0_g1_i5:1107-1790(-)
MEKGGAAMQLAPEVYHAKAGQPICYAKQDLFAVGCLIYTLCGVTQPFEDDQTSWRGSAQYDASALPSLPEEYASLQPLCIALLEWDPAARASCDDALDMAHAIKVQLVPDATWGQTQSVSDDDDPIGLLADVVCSGCAAKMTLPVRAQQSAYGTFSMGHVIGGLKCLHCLSAARPVKFTFSRCRWKAEGQKADQSSISVGGSATVTPRPFFVASDEWIWLDVTVSPL